MWITEDPWPPALLLGIGTVVLFAVWMRNQRNGLLAAWVVCLLAIPAVFVVDALVITDAEVAEQRMRELCAAFQASQVERCLSYISPSAPELGLQITAALALVQVEPNLHLKDVAVLMTSGGSRARVHFRANGAATFRASPGTSYTITSRWLTSWQKEAGEWKLVQVQRLDPLTGEPMGLFDRN